MRTADSFEMYRRSFLCRKQNKKSLNKNKNPGATLEKIEEYKYTFSVFARKYTVILS